MPTREPDDAAAAATSKPGAENDAAPKRSRRRAPSAATNAGAGLPLERLTDDAWPSAAGSADTVDGAVGLDIDEDGSWIEADAVEIHQGAVGRVDATEVHVTQGAIGAAKGERIEVNMGAVGAALGGHVTVSQGVASTVLAQEAHLEQALVRTLIARDVTFGKPSAVIFLMAQRVGGEVRVLLDWRGAIAFGAAFGILAGLFGRDRRRGRGRG